MLLGIQIINIHESFFFAMFFIASSYGHHTRGGSRGHHGCFGSHGLMGRMTIWRWSQACGYGFIATTHGHWYPRRRPSACDTVETGVEAHGFLLRILAPEFCSMSACEISSSAVMPHGFFVRSFSFVSHLFFVAEGSRDEFCCCTVS